MSGVLDPSGQPGQRYFDGTNWTDQRAPAALQAAPQKKSNTWLWVLLSVVGVAVLFFGGCVAFVGGMIASDVEDSTVTKVAAPVGSSVRDGKFEFEVLGVDRSASKQGVFSSKAAKGEFFIVHLRVTNIGDDARSFSASNQHLIVNGNKYDATVSMADENWLEDINPGLSIEASLTFDIPRGAVPEAIEVHDSMFSGGALLAV
jgi:hypothetical protein